MRENTDQYNSEYGHFSCSVMLSPEHEMSAPVVPCTEKKSFVAELIINMVKL